ncbi:MAG: HepT-like ribonuclease domain-containing protein [bacterium]
MNERDREELRLLLEDAETALRHADEFGPGWSQDMRTRDAVALRVLQVGERSKRVRAGTLLEIPDVSWKRVKGMRDWIAHDYGRVDPAVLEQVVTTHLPSLITAVRKAVGR